jgi:hypothetical protein
MRPKFADANLSEKFSAEMEFRKKSIPGEEIWINGYGETPTTLAEASLKMKTFPEYAGAIVSVGERETSLLSKEKDPCKAYSDDRKDSLQRFLDCGKSAIWSAFSQGANCSLPPASTTFGPGANATAKCVDSSAAKAHFDRFASAFIDFSDDPSDFGCPVPCVQVSYKVYLHSLTHIY